MGSILSSYGIEDAEILGRLSISPDVAYVSGSFADGFSNRRSDVDVYVVAQPADSRLSAQSPVEIVHLNGIRLDIEYWSWDEVRAVGASMNAVDLSGESWAVLEDSDAALRFAHRLRVGVPLTSEESFSHLRSLIPLDLLSPILVTLRIQAYQGVLEDASGALQSGQWETATLAARDCMFLALDGYLASIGETNPSRKWVYEKLMRTYPRGSDLYQRVWAFDHTCVAADSVAPHVNETLRFASELAVLAQLGETYPSSRG